MPYKDPEKKKAFEQRRLERLKERRATVPEFRQRELERSKKWYETKYKSDPEFRKLKHKRRVVSRYGISVEQYNTLLISQDYKCLICGTLHSDEKGKQLVIDHNHSTHMQDIRGLLCNTCNLGLGLFKDNPSVLRTAAIYLEQS